MCPLEPRVSASSNTPVGSAHAFALTAIALENREYRGRERERATRPGTERNYSPPTPHSPPVLCRQQAASSRKGNKLCCLFADPPKYFRRRWERCGSSARCFPTSGTASKGLWGRSQVTSGTIRKMHKEMFKSDVFLGFH